MNAVLQRLRAEIASDRVAFGARIAELEAIDLSNATPAVLAQAAVALHHGYSALEAVFERVARTIEGSLPAGPDWHVALLESMALDITEVRPAVLSADSLRLLRSLLAFRHFFRHAYAVAWDAEKLGRARADALALAPRIAIDLDRLDEYLAKTATLSG